MCGGVVDEAICAVYACVPVCSRAVDGGYLLELGGHVYCGACPTQSHAVSYAFFLSPSSASLKTEVE